MRAELEPVVAAAARELGLAGRYQSWSPPDPLPPALVYATDWAVLAREPEDLRPLASHPRWRFLEDDGRRVWTDGFSGVVGILRW